jgi:hypothetical protein
MIESIEKQFDSINIYDNEVMPDLSDNGKFIRLDAIKKPEYFFTLDDDLIYPPDYVSKTIEAIEKYGCIIAHHGRQLTGLHRDYYTLHKAFRCLDPVYTNEIIDCCGTGVTAFRTDYFHPKGLAHNPNQRMSDLIFSLEAAKQKKTIGIIEHEGGWIKPILNKESIFETESRTGNKVQNLIANEIYKLNHG